jgi:hypothetical protein
MLDAHERGEATDREANAAALPEIERKFLQGETSDVTVGESVGSIALIVGLDVHENEGTINVAESQRALLKSSDVVSATEEHGVAGSGRARGKAHGRVAKALMENSAHPRNRVVSGWLDVNKTCEGMRILHGRAVNVEGGRAAVENGLHRLTRGRGLVSELVEGLAMVPLMARSPAEPADDVVYAVDGFVVIVEAAVAASVEIERLV